MPEARDSSDPGLGQFLRCAARATRLSAAQERELARRIERGDARAREHMTEANILLVVSVAKRYRNPGIPLADLIQEGTIGLMRAVEKFDYRRGNRFSTYAVIWIRQYVLRAMAEKSRLVRLPAGVNARLLRLGRLERELRVQLGREPTSAELAVSVGMTPAAVEHLLQIAAPVASLDEPAGDDGALLRDLVPDANAPDPVEALGVDKPFVEALLDGLSPRQRQVIDRRFGLAGHEAASAGAVALTLGVTRARVKQLEVEALKRMHRSVRSHDLRPGASAELRLRAMQETRRGGQHRAEAA